MLHDEALHPQALGLLRELAAITNRGTRKDFVDLSFLLDEFGLDEMLNAYACRSPEGMLFLVAKSLAFFDDAEEDPMPIMLVNRSWEAVQDSVIHAIRNSTLLRTWRPPATRPSS